MPDLLAALGGEIDIGAVGGIHIHISRRERHDPDTYLFQRRHFIDINNS
jgi:hypothetical protein